MTDHVPEAADRFVEELEFFATQDVEASKGVPEHHTANVRAAILQRILPYCLPHYVNIEGGHCEGDGSR